MQQKGEDQQKHEPTASVPTEKSNVLLWEQCFGRNTIFLGGFGEGTLARAKGFILDPVLSNSTALLEGELDPPRFGLNPERGDHLF